jgi:hypothetical protein
MFRRNRNRLTQRLSGSAYSLTIPGGKRVVLWLLVALLLVVCVVAYVTLKGPSPALQMRAEIERLQHEVDRLQHEVQVGDMRMQQEIATREGLMHQMNEQAQKLHQAEQELEFFRGQKSMTPRDKTLHK